MSKIINKFLLTGNKFMPELHLKQPRFVYSLCGPFTKHTGRIQKSYSDSKYLTKRTISDKILKGRGYKIARNHKYDGNQRALASIIYNFFDKKTGSRVSVNEKIAEESHKSVIKKF